MALPSLTQTVTDGALGVLPDNVDHVHVKLGVSIGGTPNTLYSFNDLGTLQSTLTGGPLMEACAYSLSAAGGPVYAMPVTSSVAGTSGSITKSNSGGPTVTVAGAPTDAYDVIIKITRTGTLGAAAMQVSLDGGDSYAPETTVPSGGTYAPANTGLTFTFPAGTYTAADTFTMATVAPGYSADNLTNAATGAIPALLADPRDWKFMHIVGQAADVATSAGIAGALDTALRSAFTAKRPAYAIMEAPDDTDSNLVAGFAAVSSVRVAVAAGFEELISPITGQNRKRSAGWVLAAKRAMAPISEDSARVASGPVPGIVGTSATKGVGLFHDERVTPALEAGRFSCLWTVVGFPGVYIAAGRMMSAPGSDYDLIQNREVMDVACRVANQAGMLYLNDSVRVNRTTGFIDERDARGIESYIRAQLSAALLGPGHASDVTVTVKRNENMLSTRTLRLTVRVLPLAYAKFIVEDLGFVNPQLSLT